MMASTRRLLLFSLMAVVLFSGAVPTVSAQQETPTEDEVNRVARELYCPVCENIPLDTCGTKACEQWRGVIRDKISEGWTDEQIKIYFVDQYGDRVLAEPPPRGFNWLVYLVPPAVFLAGVLLVFFGYQRWKKPDKAPAVIPGSGELPPGEDPPDEFIRKVEEELRIRKDE